MLGIFLVPLLVLKTSALNISLPSRSTRKALISSAQDLICATDSRVVNFYSFKTSEVSLTFDLLKAIHSCKTAGVQVFSYSDSHGILANNHGPSLQILVIPNSESFLIDYCLEVIKARQPGKKFLKYLLVFENRVSDLNAAWIRETFDRMWKKNVLNVAVIFETTRRNEVKVLMYDPFAKDDAVFEIFRSQGDIFDENSARDLDNQTIVVTMGNDGFLAMKRDQARGFDGVDGKVAELMEQKLNATFVYNFNDYGYIYPNGTFTGGWNEVVQNLAHISFNSHFQVLGQESLYETTNSYIKDSVCVVVPKGQQISMFYNLFYTMQGETWIAAVVFVLVTASAYKVVQEANKRVDKEPERLQLTWSESLMMTLQSFLGDALIRVPKSASLRLIIVTWAAYSLVICSAFTGELISKLAIPQFRPDIDTLEQLRESRIGILVRDQTASFRHIWDQRTLLDLNEQFRVLPEEEFFERLHRNNSNEAFVLRSHNADFEIARTFNKASGRPSLHKMRQCLLYFPRVYIVNTGSPFLGEINSWLARFIESGFLIHWDRMADFQARLKGLIADAEDIEELVEDIEDSEDDEIKVVLSLIHLQSAFIFLAAGLVAGLVAFVGEIYWNRLMRKRQSRVIYINRELAVQQGFRGGLK